ncbi:calponin homology domain-containing protein, partial [Tanacetum coccineum]
FEVSKELWNMLLVKYMELKNFKGRMFIPVDTRKSSGRYRPYSNVCKVLGLSGVDLFSPSDVVEKKDTRKVCICIRSLSMKARSKQLKVPDFDVVTKTVAMPTDVVRCIRRSLELSTSSVTQGHIQNARSKSRQKSPFASHQQDGDEACLEESDEVKSNYSETSYADFLYLESGESQESESQHKKYVLNHSDRTRADTPGTQTTHDKLWAYNRIGRILSLAQRTEVRSFGESYVRHFADDCKRAPLRSLDTRIYNTETYFLEPKKISGSEMDDSKSNIKIDFPMEHQSGNGFGNVEEEGDQLCTNETNDIHCYAEYTTKAASKDVRKEDDIDCLTEANANGNNKVVKKEKRVTYFAPMLKTVAKGSALIGILFLLHFRNMRDRNANGKSTWKRSRQIHWKSSGVVYSRGAGENGSRIYPVEKLNFGE